MIDVIATTMPALAATVPTAIKEYVLPAAQAIWTVTYYIVSFVLIMIGLLAP